MRVRRELAGDYEVHAELGRGGMAVVYRATELELLRPVALKVLPPELAASASMSERFRREARLAASFDHPNIIPIYRVGQAGGIFYIAMKYVEGRPLDDLLAAQGALPIPVVLLVLRAAVRALAFAHQNGIIHRDIKGANILVDQDGRIVVSDFGIARAGEDSGLTATGMLMGTPYFMSPEQCAGHRVGAQSDQYSLGVVAFQMITGSVPFHSETIPGVMQHHFFTPVPDMTLVRNDVPEALLAVVHKALAKRADDRFATTLEMQQAIEAIRFDDEMRIQGERMLRDLVLGVALPKVHAGVLPPLQDTLLMTPPLTMRARNALKQRTRNRVVAGVAGSALVLGALGYQFLWRQPVFATPSVTAAPPAGLAAPGADAPARDIASTAGAPPVANTPAAPPSPSGGAAGVADPAPVPLPAARDTRPTAESPVEAEADAPAGATGKLRVRVLPSDAEILVDGRVLGRGVVLDSLLPAGSRRLRARAPGYQPLDTVITVQAGGTSQVGTLRLVPEGRP